MKRKTFKHHRNRVRRLAAPWLHVLGLGWYEQIDFNYYDSAKDYRKTNGASEGGVMMVWADWRYLRASIAVNVPAVARLNDEQLERVIVHEFVHILVNEMRETGIDHEERTVTMITKALFWTRANAVEQFGGIVNNATVD